MIDLAPQYLEEVKRILRSHLPGAEVRVFGSRVNGRAHTYSDLDLALVAPAPVGWRKVEELKDAFAASDLPITVDVLDWNSISASFREVIAEQCEVIQTPE